MAASTIDSVMVALVAAEAREALGASLARSKMPPQPGTFLHYIMWFTRSWFGQLDPRVGLRMAPWGSLAAPCGSQTLF